MKRPVLFFVAIASAAGAATAIPGSAVAQSTANYCELEKVRELGTFEKTTFLNDDKWIATSGGNAENIAIVFATETGAEVKRINDVSYIHIDSGEGWLIYTRGSTKSTDANNQVAVSISRGVELTGYDVFSAGRYLVANRAEGIEVLRKTDGSKWTWPISGMRRVIRSYGDTHIAVHVNSSAELTVRDLNNPDVPIRLDLGEPVAKLDAIGSQFSSDPKTNKLLLAASIADTTRDLYRTYIFDVRAKSLVTALDGYFFPRFVPGGRYLIATLKSRDDPVSKFAVVDLTNPRALRHIVKGKGARLDTESDFPNSVSSDDTLIDLATMKERPLVRNDFSLDKAERGGLLFHSDGIFLDAQSKQAACKAIRVDGRDYQWGFHPSSNRQFLAVKSKPDSDSNAKRSIDLYRLLDKSAIESRIAELRERSKRIPTASKGGAQKMFFSAFELFQAGEFRSAHKAFSQALELDPTNPQGHFLMAETLSRLNDRNTARLHYRYTVAFGGGSKEAHIAEDRLTSFK